jgi:hypothetical protein
MPTTDLRTFAVVWSLLKISYIHTTHAFTPEGIARLRYSFETLTLNTNHNEDVAGGKPIAVYYTGVSAKCEFASSNITRLTFATNAWFVGALFHRLFTANDLHVFNVASSYLAY